jgi:T-complex protein 1 subunit zeta
MLLQGSRYLAEGTHPSQIIEGINIALPESKKFLEQYKRKMAERIKLDREVRLSVARTALSTKVKADLASKLADIVVDAVDVVRDA